ncbi:hypothetical protein GQ457_09G014020 [Hibiscus cannabinus]
MSVGRRCIKLILSTKMDGELQQKRTQDKLKDISGCMEQGMGTENRGQVTLFLLDLNMRGGAKTTSWPWY